MLNTTAHKPATPAASAVPQEKLWQWLRYLAALGCIVWLYWFFSHGDKAGKLWAHVSSLAGSPAAQVYVVICLLLVPVNQGIESLKWWLLVRSAFPRFRLFSALKGHLSGNTLSIWMPGRSGEFIGRLAMLPAPRRGRCLLLSLLGSWSQLMVTLAVGIAGLLPLMNQGGGLRLLLWGVMALGAVSLLWWQLSAILLWLRRIYPPARNVLNRPALKALGGVSASLKWRVLLLSLLRYAVFSLQFSLLALAFGYQGAISYLGAAVCVMWLIQSLMPLPGPMEVAARSVAAGLLLPAEVAVPASLVLYLLNVILPSVPGLWFSVEEKTVQTPKPRR